MKKIYIVLLLIGALAAHGQQKSSVETRALMQEFTKSKSAAALTRQFGDLLAVECDAKGGATVRVVAKVAPGTEAQLLEKQGIRVSSRVQDIVTLRLPVEKLTFLEQCPEVLQYTVAHRAVAHVDKGRVDTRADSVQQGLGLPQAFKGDGVMVGVCDWGFDYQHPNINSSAEKRVHAAWDMFKTSGPAPEGFDYGTLYTGYQELTAAQVDTSNIYGYNSHGTHCAGIIGGRGTKKEGNSSNQYIGMAPHVRYLFGSWLLSEDSWLDQVAWMNRVAREQGQRLVISNSWGMYSFSAIDGTSLASQALDYYAQDSNIVFVTSAGNNGDANCHLRMQMNAGDTVRTFAKYYSGNGGQMLIFWGTPGEQFSVGFGMSAREQDSVTRSRFFSTEENTDFEEGYLVVDNGDTVHYWVMTEASNYCNQRPHILLKVDKCGNDKLHLFVTPNGASALVHGWNINYLREHESNVGMDFVRGTLDGYINGDNRYTIGEPACAEMSIAVAAHRSGMWRNDTIWDPGDMATFTSYGPLMDGRVKPDISAPGVSVVSSVSSWDASQTSSVAQIPLNGRTYRWATMSGTSMSGPMVAGACALMLQANPGLSVAQVKEIIHRTAINDAITGPLRELDSVSLRCGYGKLDAYACVCAALDTPGELEVEQVRQEAPLEVFPNPATDRIVLRTYTLRDCQVEVYSLDGHCMYSGTVRGGEAQIEVRDWSHGTYILRCHDGREVRTTKIVK